MEIDPELKAAMAKVETHWNSFRKEGGKPFRLKVVECLAQGENMVEYTVCPEQKAQYACHNTAMFEAKERITWLQGHQIVLFEYRSCYMQRRYITKNYAGMQLRLRRAHAGKKLTREHMLVLELEAEWNALWKERRAMVVRALFWIFKGQARDFRFSLLNELIETAWYAEAH